MLPENALKTLHDLTSDETDIIVGFSWQGDNSVSQVPIAEWHRLMLQSNPILCTRWAKLYRRCLLNEQTMSGLPSIKLGEDMIQNIKVAFKMLKPVTVVQSKVYEYNRNDGSYSNSYRWTVEKCNTLYKAVQDSVPGSEKDTMIYQRAIVANGLGMLRTVILKGSDSERRKLSGSEFVALLRTDAEKTGYQLSASEKKY